MRRNGRRIAVAALVTALVLIGGGLWWWQQPSKSTDVPASACWGLVTADDLRTLMHDDGKAVKTPFSSGDLSGRSVKAECEVEWQPAQQDHVVEIGVAQIEEDYYRATRNHETEMAGTGQNTVLDFGAGVEGWLQPFNSLLLLLRCDNGRPAQPRRVYRQIHLSGGRDSGLPERERLQLFTDLARRTAAEIVRQEGCPDVRIAERAPVVAG
ncbi:hypothetical protein ACFVVU_00680 [Kitasatospora sp. NPDC057965]|uniref:hypothetical protein n=1 Tax=Kitasatospora sp. NPDC057965 TaxID=3346291 RepID=UPI0036DE484F